ncbi:MAG: glycosyltransferase family 9 protein [Elusimicrobiota bacterium]|jgi:ADP-heptose:LPS heptosyltransferase|nr:glycosyltransferase family 9 protein [Elusimicrobiota bacterium]
MKVLIIKPSSFGDIVQALPCADALKRSFDNVHISWVAFNQWKDILKLCPDIDEIIGWDRTGGIKEFLRLIKFLRKTKYDFVFDLQGLLRSASLAKFIKADNKIGVSGMKELSNLLIKEVYPQNAKINATLRNLEIIRYAAKKVLEPAVNIKFDIETIRQSEKILTDAGIFGDFIVLQPFARGKGKDWSIENYKKFIDLWVQNYPSVKIVVLGTQKDFGSICKDGIFDLCGKTDLKQLAAVLSKSKAAIGADTGSMHLAAMLNIPSVFIFGNSNINETAPYIGKFSLIINDKNHKDINKISPEKVFAETQKLIKT